MATSLGGISFDINANVSGAITGINNVQAAVNQLNQTTNTAQNNVGQLENALRGAVEATEGMAKAAMTSLAGWVGVAFTAKKAFDLLEEASKAVIGKIAELTAQFAMASAEATSFEHVLRNVAGLSGYSGVAIDKAEKSVRQYGISIESTRKGITNLARTSVDLAEASKLSALALDASVVSGKGVDETFERLTDSIHRSSPRFLETIGFFNQVTYAHQKMADALGKTINQLTQSEREQAIFNNLMEQGRRITGSFNATNEDAWQLLGKLQRQWKDISVTFGDSVQPAFREILSKLTETTTWILKNSDALKEWAKVLIEWGEVAVGVAYKLANIVTSGVLGGVLLVAKALKGEVEGLQKTLNENKAFNAPRETKFDRERKALADATHNMDELYETANQDLLKSKEDRLKMMGDQTDREIAEFTKRINALKGYFLTEDELRRKAWLDVQARNPGKGPSELSAFTGDVEISVQSQMMQQNRRKEAIETDYKLQSELRKQQMDKQKELIEEQKAIEAGATPGLSHKIGELNKLDSDRAKIKAEEKSDIEKQEDLLFKKAEELAKLSSSKASEIKINEARSSMEAEQGLLDNLYAWKDAKETTFQATRKEKEDEINKLIQKTSDEQLEKQQKLVLEQDREYKNRRATLIEQEHLVFRIAEQDRKSHEQISSMILHDEAQRIEEQNPYEKGGLSSYISSREADIAELDKAKSPEDQARIQNLIDIRQRRHSKKYNAAHPWGGDQIEGRAGYDTNSLEGKSGDDVERALREQEDAAIARNKERIAQEKAMQDQEKALAKERLDLIRQEMNATFEHTQKLQTLTESFQKWKDEVMKPFGVVKGGSGVTTSDLNNVTSTSQSGIGSTTIKVGEALAVAKDHVDLHRGAVEEALDATKEFLGHTTSSAEETLKALKAHKNNVLTVYERLQEIQDVQVEDVTSAGLGLGH